MCEINPKHSRFFRLEAFTANPACTAEQFEKDVMTRVFNAEQLLNADGQYRFHIHEIPASVLTHGDNRKCPKVQSGEWKFCKGHKHG